jgi:internalin A
MAFGGHGELNDEYELVALDLHDSPVTDNDMLPVLACTQLQMVNLSGTQVGDAGLACLRNLVGVRELWLTGTNVSDEGIKMIAGFGHLKSISLARTQVSDAGLKQLESLTELEILHVGETSISDEGLRHLRGLGHLREVYATESRVTTGGASELADAIPAVQVFGGAEPEKPVEEIESRVLG